MWETASDISGRDFERFLESTGVTSVCAQCGHDHQTIMTNDGTAEGKISTVDLRYSDETNNGYVGSITYTCNHCGYMRFFYVKFVLARLKEIADNGE